MVWELEGPRPILKISLTDFIFFTSLCKCGSFFHYRARRTGSQYDVRVKNPEVFYALRAGLVWYSGKNSGIIFTVNTDRRAYVEPILVFSGRSERTARERSFTEQISVCGMRRPAAKKSWASMGMRTAIRAGRPGKMKKAAWPGSCRMPMAMSSVMKRSNPW